MLEIDECVRRRGFNAQTDWTTFVFKDTPVVTCMTML